MASRWFRAEDRPWLHAALLVATALTTFGAFFGGPFQDATTPGAAVRGSLVFSACLLLILGSHEMGHYILARIHGVDTSLPFFIPFPFGVGTLGAVIRIRGKIPNRNALVDIGAAGPLAGLVVALPVLVYGILHSPVTDAAAPWTPWPTDTSLLGVLAQLWGFFQAKWHGVSSAAPPATQSLTFFGNNLLTVGLKHLLLGPLPVGRDIHEHPAYLAAWFGLLVTLLNLIPVGQLDGGHMAYAVFGDRARWLGKAVAAGMVLLCLFASVSWLLWLGLSAGVVGFRHPEVAAPEQRLTPLRLWICVACLVSLVLCAMPIPLTVMER